MSDMERLELFEKLEKAEGRIVALEKQKLEKLHCFTFWKCGGLLYLTCHKVVKVLLLNCPFYPLLSSVKSNQSFGWE